MTRRVRRSACVFLVLAPGCAPEPAAVPITEEPRHHLVSEREFAQVLDIRILGGDTTLFHIHARPIAYACVGGSEMATQVLGGDWNPPGSPCDPGFTFSNPEYADQPLTHRVANTGDDFFHLVGVQSLRERSQVATLAPAAAGTVGVDNDWFRGSTIDLGPGEIVPEHRHDVPTLMILAWGGAVASVASTGRTNMLMEPGAWAWFEPGTHYITGPDSLALRLVEFEAR